MGGSAGSGRPTDERSVRERFELALRAGGVGTWRWDIPTGVIDWDASMEGLYGFEPGTFDGTYETYASRLHPDDRPRMQAALRRALADRTPEYHVEHRILLPDGRVRWFSSTAQLGLDESGEPVELMGVAVDVTDRREAELAREAAVTAEDIARRAADAAQRRLQMLARASGLLDSPLDLDETLQRVADLAIAELADWCTVDVVSAGEVHHAAVAHRDPAMVALAREIQSRYPPDPESPVVSRLFADLEPVFVPVLEPEMLDQIPDPEQRSMLRRLELSSYLVVPLVTGGRAVGTMLLAATDGRHLDGDDVDLAMELARRAGSLVEKVRLHDELRATADQLQASLLPPTLPEIAGVALSAHYRSGTHGIDIGGDYYDLFSTGADRWWAVLGDVCGKGPAAAALTMAVRYTLHALAPSTDDPAALLQQLNDVLRAEAWEERFTTLVITTFREGAAGDLHLRVVSGGHPPPLLHRVDGTVSALSTRGTIVGILDGIEATAEDAVLAPGDTLLLYTDGASEARDSDGRELGESVLAELLASHAPTVPAAELASVIAGDVLDRTGGVLRDDLALLTITR